jgi:GntR family transcriptional repressor for pyruvate dehydrogenase complex
MYGLTEDIKLKQDARIGVAQATVTVLQDMIRDGRLKIGAAVPPQRELARDLNVSRASLREALSILATIGVLSIQPGRGTYVCEMPQVDRGGLLAASGRFAAYYSATDVYQFRYIAESHAAQLAAMRHDGSGISELQRNLEVFRRASQEMDVETYMRTDFEFHGLIIAFSGNRLLAHMHRTFTNVVLESQRLPLTRRAKLWDAVVEHERIVEALAMNDPDGAGYYMRQHISRSGNRAGIMVTELA